jgi:enamine deaminase RidA (YjgF/YER057c/UK114 family)
MTMQVLQPPEWARPKGYSNGLATRGTLVFIAGQIGWNAAAQFESTDLVEQIRQALKNVVAILREADAGPEHLVRMTWYLVDKAGYLDRQREIGAVYREVIGRHFPVMTAVVVAGLIEPAALVEIECTAVRPDPA